MITVEQLLMTAREEGASDVHITVGVPPRMRVNGRIANLDYPSLSAVSYTHLPAHILADGSTLLLRRTDQANICLYMRMKEELISLTLKIYV